MRHAYTRSLIYTRETFLPYNIFCTFSRVCAFRCAAFAILAAPAEVAEFDDVGRSETTQNPVPSNRGPGAVVQFQLDRRQTLYYRPTGDYGPGDAELRYDKGNPAGFFGLGSLPLWASSPALFSGHSGATVRRHSARSASASSIRCLPGIRSRHKCGCPPNRR